MLRPLEPVPNISFQFPIRKQDDDLSTRSVLSQVANFLDEKERVPFALLLLRFSLGPVVIQYLLDKGVKGATLRKLIFKARQDTSVSLCVSALLVTSEALFGNRGARLAFAKWLSKHSPRHLARHANSFTAFERAELNL